MTITGRLPNGKHYIVREESPDQYSIEIVGESGQSDSICYTLPASEVFPQLLRYSK